MSQNIDTQLPQFPLDGQTPSRSWAGFETALCDLAVSCHPLRPHGFIDMFYTIEEIRLMFNEPNDFEMPPLLEHPGAAPTDNAAAATHDRWYKRCTMYQNEQTTRQALQKRFHDALGKVPRNLVDPTRTRIQRLNTQEAMVKLRKKIGELTTKDVQDQTHQLKESFIPGHHAPSDFITEHVAIHLKLADGKAPLSDCGKIDLMELALRPCALFT